MTPALTRWKPRPPPVLATAAIDLLMQFACIALFAHGQPLAGLVLHVASSGLLAAAAWRRGLALTPATAILRMTALMQPFLGPVAASACVVILAIIGARHDPAANAARWHEHLFPNLAADDLTERTEAISRRQPASDAAGEIESFYDVLRWGTLPEQEHVLALISRSFRPEFAPVLRAGLAVADLGLRAQAAAGLSLLEARTSTRLSHLQQEFAAALGGAQRDAAVALAQALSDAAHSGLYDDARAAEMRLEIVSILTPLAGREPVLGAMLGRTLIQLGDFDRAVATLDAAEQVDERGEAAFAWLVEGIFRQGDYERLATVLSRRADRVRTIVRADGPLAPALRFWGEAA